ncbi:MAG: hypothetical protein ACOCUR_01880 [Nanoarchaeota archaeon]
MRLSQPKKNSKNKKSQIAFFVARVGGWDGIALQAELWLNVLLSLRKQITLVTGEIETSPGPLDKSPFSDVAMNVIPELSLEHQKELYKLSFKKKYNRDVWIERFYQDKKILKRLFWEQIKDVSFVMLHNFSIKHLIPSAWAAMYELMIENKDKKFISIAADSPFERSYIMEKFSPEVLALLKEPKIWYNKTPRKIKENLDARDGYRYVSLPGPDKSKNLKYIILNSNQKKIFHNIYGIPDEDLFAIPDMGGFDATAVRRRPSKKDFDKFFDYLSKNQLTNGVGQFDKNCVYFISPVRPIRRKKLVEVAYACKLFQEFLHRRKKNNKVVLVVTHPNRDEKPYFTELRRFARKIGLTFVFLGEDISLRKGGSETYTYSEVMNFFSYLNSICVVGSEFGGWENGILESTEHKIPVCVNPLLPSFQDMTALGYNYIPAPILIFSDAATLKINVDLLDFPSIKSFFKKVYNRIFVKKARRLNINHNYSIGLKKQSKDATKILIKKMMNSFER